MDFIISLAHFCEVCGPTSTICTQISPANCVTCHPCVTPPSEDPPRNSSSYTNWTDPSSPTRLSSGMPDLGSPLQTPPLSPRTPGSSYNPYFPNLSIDSMSQRRFSESLEMDGEGCENCNFLVPEKVRARLPDGAPGSPSKDGKRRNGSPVLRSCESILARGSSHHSVDGDNTPDSANGDHLNKSFNSGSSSSPTSLPSAPASPLSLPRNTHTHTLTYLSTRQPISPSAYSLLRRSYVRTFSCETLPKNSRSGPLYFGDPSSGYTIAYVFRLPDPRARGRLRTYALIALGGRDSWRVSMAMVKVLEHFESIASQIIAMADRVLERESPVSRPTTAIQQGPISPILGTSGSSLPMRAAIPASTGNRSSKPVAPTTPSSASSPNVRNITPVSSFLSAKKVDPDGYPRVSREVMRAKGLAEIVGKQDFFVDLHAKFCVLLSSLIRDFGGGASGA